MFRSLFYTSKLYILHFNQVCVPIYQVPLHKSYSQFELKDIPDLKPIE